MQMLLCVRHRQQGVIALTFALAMLLLLFAGTLAFLLTITAGGLRVENSHNYAQALYAAEAGIDIALQRGHPGSFTGQVGRGRYAVRVRGRQITAVGQVERPAGVPIRCAVVVRSAGRGIVRGSWRQVPPARETDLIALLRPPAAEGSD